MAAMPHFRSLLHLDVGRSRMNVESMDLLAEVLPQMHSLHSLSMEDALSMTVGDLTDYSPLSHASDLVRRLGVVLPLCKSLKKLDLKDNCIGKREGPGLEAANMLARVLPQCGKLTTLNLAANDIGETMPCDLIDRLPQIPSLEHLNLRQNKLFDEGDDAMMQLVEVLPKCTSLTHLNLSKNNIIPPDMALLAGALPHCTSLEHLDLSENLFGDKGVIHLAAVLPLCTTLRFINLRDCNLEEGGSLAMQQVLRNCPLPPTVQTE